MAVETDRNLAVSSSVQSFASLGIFGTNAFVLFYGKDSIVEAIFGGGQQRYFAGLTAPLHSIAAASTCIWVRLTTVRARANACFTSITFGNGVPFVIFCTGTTRHHSFAAPDTRIWYIYLFATKSTFSSGNLTKRTNSSSEFRHTIARATVVISDAGTTVTHAI